MKFDDTNTIKSLGLEKMGFCLLRQGEHSIEYIKDRLIIEIFLDDYSYELSAFFAMKDISDKVYLQDALDYFNITEYRGTYQLSSLEKLPVGLDYMTDVIGKVTSYFVEKYEVVFLDIVTWHKATHKKFLEEYYFNTDMEKAERYWKEKEYGKAKELYEKNGSKLSKLQLKRLKYISREEI